MLKDSRLNIRISRELRERIEMIRLRERQTLGEVARTLLRQALADRPAPTLSQMELRSDLLRTLRTVSNNLNQLARIGNQISVFPSDEKLDVATVQATAREVGELANQLRQDIDRIVDWRD